MKKFVVSSMVLAVSTGAVHAQSYLTLSGSVYGGLGFNSGGSALRTALAGTSSFMISGKEDMGGGLSALVKLENGFNADTGTTASSTFFDKQAFLGLQGTWGTVRMGRLYTPSFATLALVGDPTATYGVFTATNLMETHGVRLNNGIIYNSPGFNPWTYARKGFYGALAHYFGESPTGGASRNSATGFSLGYGQAGLSVEISHHQSNLYTNATLDVDAKSTIFAANYKWAQARLFFAYSDNSARNVITQAKTKDNTDILLGISYPLSSGTLSASYIRKDNQLLPGNDAYQIGAMYEHFLSKRSKVTLGFARIHNRNPARPHRISNGYAGTTAVTAGTTAITLGMTHRF
ncbi:porin [Pantoea sp. 18069]|uniref:porin n=1 Tax=Pantoea sp. 18069 TaxID=2681415 RepID=UPI001358BD70|nr:porin [Pantoea sp. 18069]